MAERDSKNIINYLKGITKPSWTIENIIQQVISTLQTLDNHFIYHVYRESNSIDDSLANVVVKTNHRMM